MWLLVTQSYTHDEACSKTTAGCAVFATTHSKCHMDIDTAQWDSFSICDIVATVRKKVKRKYVQWAVFKKYASFLNLVILFALMQNRIILLRSRERASISNIFKANIYIKCSTDYHETQGFKEFFLLF
jgi:hypothetical protein